ncbi:LuxR C-terminal-related transcriptional regulator [Nonomuraea sp. NPDC005650]|uniref:LuxR C-terminal-related transcriptional regulator n=1 Tax=Nonomuraea sp. NPDC005650 TaxID=3157045 RepID=UPI0033A28BB3
MSRSTVKTHLSNVYAKLGVANRTELAGVASFTDDRAAGDERIGRSQKHPRLAENAQ